MAYVLGELHRCSEQVRLAITVRLHTNKSPQPLASHLLYHNPRQVFGIASPEGYEHGTDASNPEEVKVH